MLFYRLILTLIAPILLAAAILRVIRRRESWTDFAQRLGISSGKPREIWLHGASNGELTSARPLLDALPDHRVIVTSNTTSGRDLVESWKLPHVTARLAPFDFRLNLALFRVRFRPAVLIILENELWPNRIVSSKIPVLCVGARLSEKSAKAWARFPRLAQRVFGCIASLNAQDDASARRFRSLGVAADRIGPVVSLKPDVVLAEVDVAESSRLSAYFNRADTILAASTHEGEDEVVLGAFIKAQQERPSLKLILAPRHPRRAGEIRQLIEAAWLDCATRTLNEVPSKDVYLADTLGEMGLWYALAGVSFVGGSLRDHGGHTPYEPTQAGSAILHGPHVGNFSTAYEAMGKAGAALQVSDADSLAQAIVEMHDPKEQSAMADKALDVLMAQKSDLTPVIDMVRRFLR